jgi:hypothetical protein
MKDEQFVFSVVPLDQPIADRVAKVLDAMGYRVRYSNFDFLFRRRPGQENERMIAFLSPEYLETKGLGECHRVLAGDPLNRRDRLILMRVKVCTVPRLLAPLRIVDLVPLLSKQAGGTDPLARFEEAVRSALSDTYQLSTSPDQEKLLRQEWEKWELEQELLQRESSRRAEKRTEEEPLLRERRIEEEVKRRLRDIPRERQLLAERQRAPRKEWNEDIRYYIPYFESAVQDRVEEELKRLDKLKALSKEELLAERSAANAHIARLPRRIILDALATIVRRATNAKSEPIDLVDVSAFAPNGLAGETIIIQIFLHRADESQIAQGIALEADPQTARRGVSTLATEIRRGQRVDIILEAQGLTLSEPSQYLVWRGEARSCQFIANLPADAGGRTYHIYVRVVLDTIPIGSLAFALEISRTRGNTSDMRSEMRGDWAKRYRYAFLSYASGDRAEVLKRAQALRAARIRFFHDLLSIEPGERWAPTLFKEIDRCDLFILFWSWKAAQSEWVRREAEYALDRRSKSANATPDITPIILEGPPIPCPPESLKDIHFNDALRYVIASVEAEETARSH